MMKGSNAEKDVTIVNIYAPITGATKYLKKLVIIQ